jgi:membrane protein implicated in regulation of membrane protease activity
MFLLLAVLLLIFLPSPWDFIAALVCGAVGVGEVVFWQRRMRLRKVVTGVENLVGATGEVTEPCAPLGQVRLGGELWKARSTQELSRGTPVRVVSVQGLTLEVEPTSGASSNGVGRLGLLAVVLVVGLAGCGGDDDDNSAESWASSVCSDLSTYATDVENSTQSLTDAGLAVDTDDIRTAITDVKDATNTLGNELEALGVPETEGGQQAKSELDDLTTELNTQVESVEQALDADMGRAELLTAATTAISAAANSVKSTFESLEGIDPGGELQDGFANSDDCESLRDQLNDIGS